MDRSLIFLCLQISGLHKGFLDHSQSALACLYSKCGHRVATPSRAAPYDQYQHQRTAERFCQCMDLAIYLSVLCKCCPFRTLLKLKDLGAVRVLYFGNHHRYPPNHQNTNVCILVWRLHVFRLGGCIDRE